MQRRGSETTASVDALLNELDDMLAQKPSPASAQKPAAIKVPAPPEDEIDGLLASLGGTPSPPAREATSSRSPWAPSSTPTPSGVPPFARSTPSVPLVQYEPSEAGESGYRCSKCDFKVLSFNDSSWDGTADYLFFRNHMPNRQKLAARLLPAEGKSALACQCSWANTEAFARRVPHAHWFRS